MAKYAAGLSSSLLGACGLEKDCPGRGLVEDCGLLLALTTAGRVSSWHRVLSEGAGELHGRLGSPSFGRTADQALLRVVSLALVHSVFLAGNQSSRPALPWLLRTSQSSVFVILMHSIFYSKTVLRTCPCWS